MTICPIALAVGCRKCPIFAVCPVKSLIGDYRKADDAPVKAAADSPVKAASAARPNRGSKRKAKRRR